MPGKFSLPQKKRRIKCFLLQKDGYLASNVWKAIWLMSEERSHLLIYKICIQIFKNAYYLLLTTLLKSTWAPGSVGFAEYLCKGISVQIYRLLLPANKFLTNFMPVVISDFCLCGTSEILKLLSTAYA